VEVAEPSGSTPEEGLVKLAALPDVDALRAVRDRSGLNCVVSGECGDRDVVGATSATAPPARRDDTAVATGWPSTVSGFACESLRLPSGAAFVSVFTTSPTVTDSIPGLGSADAAHGWYLRSHERTLLQLEDVY
jgi:hypothetical protein